MGSPVVGNTTHSLLVLFNLKFYRQLRWGRRHLPLSLPVTRPQLSPASPRHFRASRYQVETELLEETDI
jgi:hypothetical protein